MGFVWDANRKGVDLHFYADPTRVYLMKDHVKNKKAEIRDKHKNQVLDRYGGEEHLQKPDNELIYGQTADYKEFTCEGRVKTSDLAGEPAAVQKKTMASRYTEDVFINNHTSVWGSYWQAGRWGYACCHSFIKQSYCLGSTHKEET